MIVLNSEHGWLTCPYTVKTPVDHIGTPLDQLYKEYMDLRMSSRQSSIVQALHNITGFAKLQALLRNLNEKNERFTVNT